MTQDTFNAAEQFLLKQWAASRRLEEAMEAVRTRYQGVWERIQERVVQEQPDLDWSRLHVTQFWSKGGAAFGRKSWPGADKDWGAGIWFENIRLEVLADPDEPPPEAYLWVKPLAKAGIETEEITSAAATALAKLPPEQIARVGLRALNGDSVLSCSMPPRDQLMTMLYQGDSQEFVEAIMERVTALAQFTALIDNAIGESSARHLKS